MIVDSIKLAVDLASKVYEVAKSIKYNKQSCDELVQIVTLVDEQLQALNQPVPEKPAFLRGIALLISVLEEACQLIVDYQNKSIVLKAVRHQTHKNQFLEINQRMLQALDLMGLCLNVEGVVMQQRMLKAQEEDSRSLLALKEEFSALCKEQMETNQEILLGMAKLNKPNSVPQEQTTIIKGLIEKQVSSMLGEIEKTLQFQLRNIQSQLQLPNPTIFSPTTAVAVGHRGHLKYPTIEYDELIFLRLISHGATGEVWQGTWGQRTVAVKTVSDPGIQHSCEMLQREMEVLCQLKHKNIVSCYGGSLCAGHACIVLEEVTGGNLADYLATHPELPMEKRLSIAEGVLNGLNCLHMQGQVHNALSTHHILLTSPGLEPKLSDFQSSVTENQSLRTMGETTEMSLRWLPPERFERHMVASMAQDSYTYALVLWALMTGKVPYAEKNVNEICEAICCGECEAIPENIPEAVSDTIEACWCMLPRDRPAIIDLHSGWTTMCRTSFADSSADSAVSSNLNPSEVNALYEQGKVCEAGGDMWEAHGYYQRAADHNHAKALTSLGVFSVLGKGGSPVDKCAAYNFFERGGKQRYDRALFNQAMMLEKGDGVHQDVKRAEELYRQIPSNSQFYKEAGKRLYKMQLRTVR